MPTRGAAGRASEDSFHPYPWYSPRFWHGMPFSVWFELARENGARAMPSQWGMMVTVTALSAFNSVAEPLSNARFGRVLRQKLPLPQPVFIIGHWRSGTTLLHELMMLDPTFSCPSTFQCFAPGHFLLTETVLTRLLAGVIPEKRPMDNVVAGWDRPQEDEFALMNMGAPSPYRRMAFPANASDRPYALDLRRLPEAEFATWKRTMERFLRMLAIRDPRRPVLKSPPHTARVGVLAEMFPEAKFLHIVRDPFVVYPSTVRLCRSLHAVQSFQKDAEDATERYVFNAFDEMYAAFERDRPLVEPDRLHELKYEDLVADPVASLAQAYEALDLGDFSRVRKPLEDHARSMKRYRTNRYTLDAEKIDKVASRWKPFIDRYGYKIPEADEVCRA